jgi:Phasin protein
METYKVHLWRRVMAQKQSDVGQTRSVLPFDLNLTGVDFAATAKKRMEGFANAQTELFQNWQEANQQWLERVQVESNLASEFSSRLTASRSIPGAMTVYQDWARRRFEMMAEDAKHLMDNTQKLIQAGAHVFTNG